MEEKRLIGKNQIFVYGTLKKGFVYHEEVLQDSILQIEDAFLYGFFMYDLGAYPGIKPSPDGSGTVIGELLTIKKEKAIKVLCRMDELEGYIPGDFINSHYVRGREEVRTTDGKWHKAWVYVFNAPIDEARLLETGVWK